LHGDERLASVHTNFVYGADVRMVERGSGLRLALKSFERATIIGHLLGQKLERHLPVQACVLNLVGHPPASATEFLDDVVMRDGLANHD
jgi:hypothetical protein